MVTVNIVSAPTTEQLEGIFSDVRVADRNEWYAGSGSYAFESQVGLALRECPYTKMATIDGRPEVVWGAWKGILWMFATNRAVRYAKTLHKALLPELDILQDQFDTLEAYPSVKNLVHIRWLEWLGFELTENGTTGPLGHKFYHYTFIKE